MSVDFQTLRFGDASGRQLPVGGLIKRIFGFAGAASLILFFLPLIVFIAVAIRVASPGPIVFAHERVGFGGKTFRCYKFRTMVPNAEAALAEYLARNPAARREWEASRKLKNDPRITAIGNFLRVTSLDELPQLFNVLKGEMSLVGPRPIVADEAPYYGEQYAAYLSARPGMTGLWQVSGRSDTTYAQRVALDAEYVANWSPTLDISILVRTLKVVLERTGSR